MTLRTTITLALLAACTGPAIDMSAEPLTIDPEDGGAPTAGVMTLASGEHIYGDTTQSPFPVNLMEWEVENHGVFRLGGHRGLGYLPLRHLRLNADEMIEFQLDGSIAMKLQDHPTGRLLHFTEVADVWFGNTLETDALLGYQGGNGPTTAQGPGPAIGHDLTIYAQGMNGRATATEVIGGDLYLRGGEANTAYAGQTMNPGEVIIGGGRVLSEVRGNVALHDEPSDWCAMEGGLYVHDAATVPTGSPSGGGFLYASGGALYWRGSAGTVTQLGAP